MHFGLLLTLLQQPVAPAPPSPIARVEITPAAGELQIGQSLRLTVRALDANGAPVPNAQIRYFVGSDNGHVDSTGVLTAGYAGPLRVVAIAFVTGQTGSVRGEAVFRATPEPPTRVAVDPLPTRVVVGTQLTLVATAYSRHGDRRPDMAAFTTSNARVASVGADGQLRALTPGRATITAAVGSVAQRLPLVVVAPPAGRPTLTPAAAAVRTGDVVRFTTTPRDVAVAWSVGAGSGAAAIDHNGAFVAELPGVYTVRATIGAHTAEAVVRVEARRVTRGIEVRAHLPAGRRSLGAPQRAMRVPLDHRRSGLRHRHRRPHASPDRRFHDERRTHQQRRDDDRGRQIRRLLTRRRLEPQERHHDLRGERSVSPEGHRRIHRDRQRRGPQLLRLPGARLPDRRRDRLDARDRHPGPLPPRAGGAVADRADGGRSLPARHHDGGRPGLSRVLERRARHPGRGQRDEGRQSGASAARLPIQVRPERDLRSRRAAVGSGVRAGHAHRVARRPLRVRG